MNGRALISGGPLTFDMPAMEEVQVIEEAVRLDRIQPNLRLPRQIQHYLSLVDYIQVVKDEDHIKRSLRAHFERLVAYHNRFLA